MPKAHPLSAPVWWTEGNASWGSCGSGPSVCWRHRMVRQMASQVSRLVLMSYFSSAEAVPHSPRLLFVMVWHIRLSLCTCHLGTPYDRQGHVTREPRSDTFCRMHHLENIHTTCFSLLCCVQHLHLLSELLTLGFGRGTSALHLAPKCAVFRLPGSF